MVLAELGAKKKPHIVAGGNSKANERALHDPEEMKRCGSDRRGRLRRPRKHILAGFERVRPMPEQHPVGGANPAVTIAHLRRGAIFVQNMRQCKKSFAMQKVV